VTDETGEVTEAFPEETANVEELPLGDVEADESEFVEVACRSSRSRVCSWKGFAIENESSPATSVASRLAEILPLEMLTDEVAVDAWVPLPDDAALAVEFGT